MLFALCTAILATAAGDPDRPGPLAWSPDGKWLAYVQEDRAAPAPLRPGWLFEVGPNETRAIGRGGRVRSNKLWTTRPETGESVLLEDSAGPLSAPAWSRDGTSLAFGRLNRGTDGGLAWEIVVQDTPDRRRVLHREPLSAPPAPGLGIERLTPAWSPDGRMMVVPRIHPVGLMIVRVDSGRVVRTLDGATKPAWSPIDNRLAYYTLGDHPTLTLLDGVLAEPRQIATIPDAAVLPAPIWGRDAQTVMTLRRAVPSSPSGGMKRGTIFQLCRYRADGTQVDPPVDLAHDPIGPEGALAGIWFTVGSDGESAFYATASSGQASSQVTWSVGKFDVVRKRFNPFDDASLAGSLAGSPTGHSLALRVGVDGGWSSPAVCNLEDATLVPLAPDGAARGEWLARTLDATLTLLRERLPAPSLLDGTPCDRPSLLPAPGELEPGDPLAFRLKRLATIGLSVLGPPSPETDEIRLAFAYLAGDGRLAASMVDRLLSRADTPDARLRLRAVQVQIYLMRRDFDRAKPLIAYLREVSAGPSHEVADDLQGPGLTKLPSAAGSWPAYLAERSEILRKPAIDASPDLVPRNALDLDGLRGADLIAPPAPMPFQ